MRLIATAFAAIAIAITIPGAAFAKTCSAGYKKATIGGAQKCLGAGEYCTKADAGQYEKYGYICEKVHGTYRLERQRPSRPTY
jgi:hypothetical protein